MHAMATVFTRNPRRIMDVVNYYCDAGDWDYAGIGGRYWGLIPVGEKSKIVIRAENFDHNIEDGDYPLADGHPAPKTKYVSCARFRNINQREAARLEAVMGFGIFKPATFIIDNGDRFTYIDGEDYDNIPAVMEFMRHPARSFWYVIVVDYHY